MMPGIRTSRIRIELVRAVHHETKQKFLHGNHGHDDAQGPRSRWCVRNHDLVDRLDDNQDRRNDQHPTDSQSGYRFGFAITVGMTGIGRLRSNS